MSEPLDRLARFLRNLAQALHISGMPAHDLELRLNSIGQRFGVRVECFAVLTMLTLNITDEDNEQRVEMLRLPFYDYNMARLIALDKLISEMDGLDSLGHGEAQLQEIISAPPLWSGWPFVGLGFLLSGSVAVLLGGGWYEMLCGGLVGMLFVGAHQALARIPRLGPATPVILCASAALCAHALSIVLPQQTPFITAVAGVVLLLPGFTLTIAMSELATQNLLSGTGRLAGAFLLLFMMLAGLVIGTQISVHLLPAHGSGSPLPLPAWIIWPAIAALGVSMLGVLQAPLRAVHVMVGGSLLAWAVFSLVSGVLGIVVGAFAGALAVATAGHFYTFLTGQPDILVKIPGLIALVPGSMGFRGLYALMEQGSAMGIRLMTDMVLTGAVLAVGLLLADNIAPLLFARRVRR
ncbi:MAG: threonine/serine exporter family protein [Propionivibrio sp.]|uniref:Threonine/serine exporter family protein n=1 Tax=Candidatus Propionivibrio dominans TaxID=2954373 RepID=A0A9D7F9W7_9RHOO|nr:threonine/serine exporter family protein [Candidatus Propionivibrio dominans]